MVAFYYFILGSEKQIIERLFRNNASIRQVSVFSSHKKMIRK
jgi:hypothetical protein